MKAVRTLACLALLAGACCLPTAAQAQWPLYGAGMYGGGGFGGLGGAGVFGPWNGTMSSAAYYPPPPYYSIHPPVYYSPNIHRRSYGWSPFAYGPYAPPQASAYSGPATQTYEVQAPPLLIVNPFVQEGAELPAPKAE